MGWRKRNCEALSLASSPKIAVALDGFDICPLKHGPSLGTKKHGICNHSAEHLMPRNCFTVQIIVSIYKSQLSLCTELAYPLKHNS